MSDASALWSACLLSHRYPVQAADGLLVCPDHHGAIREVVQDILEFYATIPLSDVDPGPQPGNTGSKRLKKPHSPALTNLEIAAFLDPRTGPLTDAHGEYTITMLYGAEIPNVCYELSVYTDWIADTRHMAKPGGTVSEEAAFLHRHHDWICAQDVVSDYERHLRLVRSKLMAALRLPRPKLIGHCFAIMDGVECGTPLFLPPGASEVECRRCRRLYSGADLVRLKVIGAHEETA